MSEGGADSVRRVGQVWLQVHRGEQQEPYSSQCAVLRTLQITISASDEEELEHE